MIGQLTRTNRENKRRAHRTAEAWRADFTAFCTEQASRIRCTDLHYLTKSLPDILPVGPFGKLVLPPDVYDVVVRR